MCETRCRMPCVNGCLPLVEHLSESVQDFGLNCGGDVAYDALIGCHCVLHVTIIPIITFQVNSTNVPWPTVGATKANERATSKANGCVYAFGDIPGSRRSLTFPYGHPSQSRTAALRTNRAASIRSSNHPPTHLV